MGVDYHSGLPPRLKYLALAKEISPGTVSPKDVDGVVVEPVATPGGWAAEKGTVPELDVCFLAPDGVKLRNDYIDSYGRFKGNWHQRLRAEFEHAAWGRFVALLYPRDGEMPPLKIEPFAKQGFRFRAVWPTTVDYFAFDDKGDVVSVVRAPSSWQPGAPLIKELHYMMTGGSELKAGGAPLVELWDGVSARKTPIGQQGLKGAASCSGERLDVDVVVDPQAARWKFERLVEVRAFGPRVKEAFFNGVSVPFVREDDYVVFTGRARLPSSGEDAFAEAMRQDLRKKEEARK